MKLKPIYLLYCPLILTFIAPIYAQENSLQISPATLQEITADSVSKLTGLLSAETNIKYLSFSPDGALIGLVTQNLDSDYVITVTNPVNNVTVSQMQGRMDYFRSLAWSPDSKRLAVISGRITGAGAAERIVKTYTIQKGSQPGAYIMGNSDAWYVDYIDASQVSKSNPVEVAWNPQSNMLAVAFYDKFEIFDGNTANPLFTQPVNGIRTVNWSPDGKLIITQTIDNTVNAWGIPAD